MCLCTTYNHTRFVVNSEPMTPLACVEALQTHFTAALTAAAAATAAKAKAVTQPAAAVTHYRMSSTGVPLSPLPLRKLSGAVPPLLPPPPSHRSANNSINNNSNKSSSSSSRNSSSVLTSDLLTGLNAELAAEQSAERSAEQAAGGSSAELSPRRAKLPNSAKSAAATASVAAAPAAAAPAPAAVVPAVVAAAYVGQCVWRALHAASRTASGGDSFFIVQDLFGGEGVLIKAARTAPPPIELVLAGLSLKVWQWSLHSMYAHSVMLLLLVTACLRIGHCLFTAHQCITVVAGHLSPHLCATAATAANTCADNFVQMLTFLHKTNTGHDYECVRHLPLE
jgi:hypothetical protein